MVEIKKKIESANSAIHSFVYVNGGDLKITNISEDIKIDVELSGLFHMKPFDKHDLARIECMFKRYVPEIQKVNFTIIN